MPLAEAGHSARGTRSFCRLVAVGQIDLAVKQSRTRPVLIFKHSVTCGVSAQAYDELMNLPRDSIPGGVYVVHVQSDRSVSATIAQRFGICHESPQILILVEGQVRWAASHFRVNASEVQRALDHLAQKE